jgi:DNA-binding transcriptional ArsR family regulator
VVAVSTVDGDTDIAAVAGLLADRGRCRILLALGDGRALPASVLAAEAGVSAPTASVHLARLVDAGLLTVERYGRRRYHRLSGPEVGELLEAIARIAPAEPVRSLRQGTRAYAVRAARVCYDHLAGRLGTQLMAALLRQEILAGGDGMFHGGHDGRDRLAAFGRGDADYRLTEHGRRKLADFGIDLAPRDSRRLVRYCVDWSEQRHHLAGRLGAALLARFEALDWMRRAPNSRAIHITERGRAGLAGTFGLEVPD